MDSYLNKARFSAVSYVFISNVIFCLHPGPRTIRPAGSQGANTLNMLEKLGLQEEIVPIKK